jgi:rubrerythrin
MEDQNTNLGHNRTGVQRSPLHGELMLDEARAAPPAIDPREPESLLMAELRREYVNEAEALGTIPPPATLKGAVKSGAGAITGHRLHVFVDKLAERLAFERGGTRLYEAVLVKAFAFAEGTPVNIERIKEIRNQELEHAGLLTEALLGLGADPTAQTPCADLVGVQSLGLIQAVTDPRTSLAQTLSTAMAAELIDVASWELLATLARSMSQDTLAERFDAALRHENEHLATIRGWVEQLAEAEARLLS